MLVPFSVRYGPPRIININFKWVYLFKISPVWKRGKKFKFEKSKASNYSSMHLKVDFWQINFRLYYKYGSRQYHESKVLHITEVTRFSIALKTAYFDTNSWKMSSLLNNASFYTFKAKIGQSFIPKSIFEFWQNGLKNWFLNKLFRFESNLEWITD